MDWDEKFIHCLANQYGSRMVSQQHPVGTKSRIDDDVVINCEPRIYMISHRRLHPRFLPSEWSMQRDSVTNFDFSLILLYAQTVVSTELPFFPKKNWKFVSCVFIEQRWRRNNKTFAHLSQSTRLQQKLSKIPNSFA